MRIGFDAKRAFFNFSGLGNYSRNTIRQLSKGFPENHYYLYIPKKKGQIENQVLENQTPVFPSSFCAKKFSSLWRSFWLSKALERDGIDLYHGLSGEIPFGIHKHRVPTVVTIHDLIFLRYPQWYKAIDRAIYTKKSRYACAHADRIIAISEQTRSDITEFFGTPSEKIEVVYQGCDPAFYFNADEKKKEAFRNKYSLPPQYLLYVGTIEPRKNLMQIIKAMQISGSGLPLLVIGRETSYAKTVREYISDQEIDNIFFLGNVPNADLPALYQMAAMFIYPSRFEGFGIPILEALNSGTPVITSKGGCFSEAGGPHSLYINPDQPDEIAAAIKQIMEDPGLARQMSEMGKKHAALFREETMAPAIMDVYKKVL
jgi:glycosyltransferase involved in cell wall biosynthesis